MAEDAYWSQDMASHRPRCAAGSQTGAEAEEIPGGVLWVSSGFLHERRQHIANAGREPVAVGKFLAHLTPIQQKRRQR